MSGPQTAPWHALSADDALAGLASRAEGLSGPEARERLARFGPNELPRVSATPAWRILLRQFASVIVLLLVGAAGIAVATGERANAVAIAAALAINVMLGFVVELRGRRAMEALRSLVVPLADVVRDGTVARIEAAGLVPGDVIELAAGNRVPADARLISVTELSINESALTGESLPVAKNTVAALEPAVALPDRVNMVFQGTTITGGRARGLVVATAGATELGRIQRLVSETRQESTPLERRLDALGRRLAVVAIVIAAVIALINLRLGAPLTLVLETAIAMAVAAVPEGLPVVVTVAMAIGIRRMARRRALVRHLPAVETLGSTTVICTDKTGTLTAGRMAVTAVWSPDGEWALAPDEEAGAFHPVGAAPDAARERAENPLLNVLRGGALACPIASTVDGADPRHDPEEAALLNAAHRAGVDLVRLSGDLPQMAELPFSSARMLSAVYRRGAGNDVLVFAKGATARILDVCDRVAGAAGDVPLDHDTRRRLLDQNTRLASSGLRVLALAAGPVASTREASLAALAFVGFVGLMDPAAPGVAETVRRLRDAGIHIVMLTGDQLPTATAVARELHLATDGVEMLAGAELDRMSDDELAHHATQLVVASRVSPETKLRIVDALRRRGEIVAMLGDGVNDAPALRKADIGVAMGRRGTDVAREAADVVLADDRFETIAVAVEEGRVIFENIRRFVFYLFSCNVGEIIVLFVAGVAGLPLPLAPLQVLWLNIVTDTFPALALAFEPGEADVMRQPPRDPRAEILSRRLSWLMIWYALLIGASSLAAFLWGLHVRPDAPAYASTLCFMTLAFAQLFHLGNARGRGPVLAVRRAIANPFALGALAIGIGLQVATALIPAMARVLGVQPMGVREWSLILLLSAVPAVVGQLWKLTRARE